MLPELRFYQHFHPLPGKQVTVCFIHLFDRPYRYQGFQCKFGQEVHRPRETVRRDDDALYRLFHSVKGKAWNADNGTGKIRGIYLQGNQAADPIFRSWLEPFKDLGASTITLQNTGGTDHLAFDAAGIPGFQFIQDPMAYFNRTHHSNMDNFDHLVEDDLKQAATIIASFVMHTAMRDAQIPRKPVELEVAED